MKGKKDSKSNIDNIFWDDIINSIDLCVLIINKELKINLINLSLSSLIGFKNIQEPIGKNWLDFIKPSEKLITKNVYNELLYTGKNKNNPVEIMNNIITSTGDITIKWINTRIQSNMVLSFGILRNIVKLKKENNKITDINNFRNYYEDVIQKDRMIIKSYQNVFNALM